jgi:hypothetical protein
MKICRLTVLLVLSVSLAAGQDVLENVPPHIAWNQIVTPGFRILYPRGFEAQAQRMANTLEFIRMPASQTLSRPARRFTVVLQNQTAISNGFVSLMPRRSEFFTMPPQDYNFMGTNDWLNLLAAHEYRHMVQFDRARTGLSRLAYYAFGPAALAGISHTAAPLWFWEGDAVAIETALTNSGRGRIPQFNLLMRTNLMEGRVFNYHKQYLRSFKHQIPDHYVLGYNMVSYLRRRTGDPLIWDKITQRAWKFPFMPFAFSQAMHRETGLHVAQLYREMATDLRKEWDSLSSYIDLTDFTPVPVAKRTGYTDYLYPQVLQDGSIIAWKRGIGHIDEFVIIGQDKDKHVFTPGITVYNGMLSAVGTRVVWNEHTFHPRWRRQTFSDIRMYDLSTRRLTWVTRRGRYAGVALAPDTTRLVAVESLPDYTTSLVILNTQGQVIRRLTSSTEAFFSMPRWTDDGKKIVALKTTSAGRSVCLFDAQTGEEEVIIPPTHENIGHPVMYRSWLLFNSPAGGTDNIYALHLPDKKRYQITESKYGAYNPVVSTDGKTIYYNEQTRDGMDVVAVLFDPDQWKPFTPHPEPRSFFQYLAEQEGKTDLLAAVPQHSYPSRSYRKVSGWINPFSWGAYFNTQLTEADIGIVSQDVLSTFSWRAGYLYNIADRTGLWRTGFSYQNSFPILDFDLKFGPRELNEGTIPYYRITGGDTVLTSGNLSFSWYERTIETGLRIPLITTVSRYIGNFTISNYIGYTQVTDFANSITGTGRIITPELPVYWLRTQPGNGTLLYNHFSMSAYRLLKRSRRDINSRWGQFFSLHGYGTPYKGDYSGNQFSFYTILYFPGLFRHHSFWGYWGYQQTRLELLSRRSSSVPYRDNNAYIFPNRIPLPRGLTVFRDQHFYTMSANYTLPVWYPDVALGPVINFQRLRINGFVDYGFGTSTFSPDRIRSTTYLSAGAEVKFDINLLRFLPQLDIGFRYSIGIRPVQSTAFELLIGTINF